MAESIKFYLKNYILIRTLNIRAYVIGFVRDIMITRQWGAWRIQPILKLGIIIV